MQASNPRNIQKIWKQAKKQATSEEPSKQHPVNVYLLMPSGGPGASVTQQAIEASNPTNNIHCLLFCDAFRKTGSICKAVFFTTSYNFELTVIKTLERLRLESHRRTRRTQTVIMTLERLRLERPARPEGSEGRREPTMKATGLKETFRGD